MRIVSFEHLMLGEDSRTHPMTCHVRLWFDGVFDRSSLEDAAEMALKRQPILRSVAVGKPGARTAKISWKPLKNIRPKFQWTDKDPEEFSPDNMRLDPFSEICLKFYIAEKDSKSVMWVRFHHAHTDGTGIFSYLEDMFINYENIVNENHIPLAALNKSNLETRAMFGISMLGYFLRTFMDLKRVVKFFKLSPEPLISVNNQRDSDGVNIRNITAARRHTFSKDDYQKLKASCKNYNVSPNDILITNLFIAAQKWNGPRSKRVRIAMPIDLRLAHDKKTPAANIVSMCFLDLPRKHTEYSNHLKTVHLETRQILKDRMGITLSRFMGIIGSIPYAMGLFTKSRSCRTTLVLTNLGKPFKGSPLLDASGILNTGGLKLTALDSIPPIRTKTKLALSINYYGGGLSITYRHDPTSFDKSSARKFASIYESTLFNNLTC